MGPEEQLLDQWQERAREQAQQRIHLAGVSRQLLSNPAAEQYLTDLEGKFLKHADERDLSDEVGRNRAYFCLSMVRGLRKWLEYCASDGEDAERQFNELMGQKR